MTKVNSGVSVVFSHHYKITEGTEDNTVQLNTLRVILLHKITQAF